MKIEVISVFPEYLEPLNISLIGKAITDGVIQLTIHDLRDYTHDKHKTVDDSPYGGGPGMVMKPEPWGDVLDTLIEPDTILIIPSPSGRPFTQQLAQEYSTAKHLVFACGRYEGIDSRVADHFKSKIRVDEVSLGDYVLAGGEVAVLVIVEATTRLIPGVLGNDESHQDDSFAPGKMEKLIEGPVFTRPPVWRELAVPEVLLSGDHEKINNWRRNEAKEKTLRIRPDLVD
jgi:tRNA (guanine37-N1)-methyltransferase